MWSESAGNDEPTRPEFDSQLPDGRILETVDEMESERRVTELRD